MAEERARGAAEGEWRKLEDGSGLWEQFRPQVGDIVEFETGLVEGHEGSSHIAAYLVTAVRETGEGSLELGGRCVGCNQEEVAKVLSSLLNRKQQALHLCHKVPCTYGEEEGVVHCIAGRWFRSSAFDASYMKPWGRLVIKEFLQPEEEEEEYPPPRRRKPALKRPAGKAGPGRASRRSAGDRRGGEGDADKLREKLKKLRGGETEKKRCRSDTVITVMDSGESAEDPESSSAEDEGESGHSGEPSSPRTTLAIKDQVKMEPKEQSKKAMLKRKRKKKKVKENSTSRDPALQLLAQAAQVRQARREERAEKKSGGGASSSTGKVRELVKALIGGKKSGRKKKSKVPKRLGPGGGDPDPSGGSSGESEEEEAGSESSSSEMLAPLQRKSQKKPGAVLKLLISHAKQALDQTSVVETKEATDITTGVKMTSYFNLMIRPYHQNNNLMKELNHLSVCLDELRAGELGKLGDSLASRFLALHTAANEGSWRAAQFLELHPLEATQGAPAALLLEARKHGKLVTKAQGTEDWRRPRGDGEWQSSGKGGATGKGKGKGKGKDWPRPGKGDQTWQGKGGWNRQSGWWASQKEKADSKDAKPAEKDPKK